MHDEIQHNVFAACDVSPVAVLAAPGALLSCMVEFHLTHTLCDNDRPEGLPFASRHWLTTTHMDFNVCSVLQGKRTDAVTDNPEEATVYTKGIRL